MVSKVIPERMAAHTDEEFVVFLIGMRINKFWKFHRWIPVALAMGRMLKELSQMENSDLLSFEAWGGRTSIMVQYWRSFDALEEYARNNSQEHMPAWNQFNRLINTNGDVGIWHETYTIKPGNFEAIYGNMPPFGLARAVGMVPAKGQYKNARNRLKAA